MVGANLEGDAEFEELGFQLVVLDPGVLPPACTTASGRRRTSSSSPASACSIEGEERHLRRWDFVHCPSMTDHVFVGEGDGSCAIVMVGARAEVREEEIIYPVNDTAAKYGASVGTTTPTPRGVPPSRAGIEPVPRRRPAGLLMVSEARLEPLPEGLGAEGRAGSCSTRGMPAGGSGTGLGRWADSEGEGLRAARGIRIAVLQPSEPSGMYHGETTQENFLVVSGECVLVIEGEERRLKRGTSSSARPGRGTPSSAPETGRALSSQWERERGTTRSSTP